MKAELVSIPKLCDTGRRMLKYLLHSKDNFIKIGNRLDKNNLSISSKGDKLKNHLVNCDSL